jgi:uncharacterized protein (TIGR02391 family)
MTEEDIIRRSAQDTAYKRTMMGTEYFVEEVMKDSSRYHKRENKAIFFEEVVSSIRKEHEEHMRSCPQGPGCPEDERYQEVLYFLGEAIEARFNTTSKATSKAVLSATPQLPLAASPLTHLHSAVQQAVGSRFADGYYSDALHKACTALEKAVQDKASQPAEPTGATLMSKVFSKDKPILTVSSNQGEQEGYMFLYRGLAQAIRNHYAHNDTATDPARALEWLGFISALFYKLEEAQSPATLPTP